MHVHSEGLGLEAPTVTPALMNDHLTGYLLAIGVVAALAEQGADVILVHSPRGDWVTPIWLSVNWGKKTVLIDIKSPDGKKRFVDLLASADVLISSQRPGALDRLGLSEAELADINPNLVYGSESFAPLVRRGLGAADLSRLRRRSPAPCTCIPKVWGSRLPR